MKRLAIVVILLVLLTGCAQAPSAITATPFRQAAPTPAPSIPVSSTINIDELVTYPPMPAGRFLYVDEYAMRKHYEVTTNLVAVISASSSRLLTRTPVATVLLFSDGTGLILTNTAQPMVRSGPVVIHYSVPPSMPYMEATVVLIHSIH